MNSLNVKILILVIANLFAITVTSQDWHFSQFNDAPILLNPANSGSYSGDYRANLNYKNQWASIGNPYRSMASSFDLPVLRDYNGYKMTGVGISILSDEAGKSKYGFTQINITGSHSITVNRFQDLSVGLGFGYGQVSANFSNLRWDNQYNGTNYDPNLPTGEGNYFPKSNYFDISAGILARFFTRDLNETQIGLSASHLNRPWQATLSNDNDDVLRMKFILHGKSEIEIPNGNNIKIIPSIYIAKQAISTEFLAGFNVKTQLGITSLYTGYNAASFIYIGGFYRYEDAFIANVAYEWKSSLKIGLSYDINFSLLTPATSSRGGLEVSISWLGDLGFNSQSARATRKK
jgi:type IX secretion system PorP/SprF family membrane protein